jgi:hypothetical protein
MATTQQINNHDAIINRQVADFGRGLSPLLTDLYDELAGLPNPTRLDVQRLFEPVRRYAQAQITEIDGVFADNDEINNEVLGPVVVDTSQLRAEAAASLSSAVEAEQNNIMSVIATSALVGGATVATIRALRKSKNAIINRLKIALGTNIRSVDNAYTLLKSRASGADPKYRYVGGIIKESRPFCRSHDGDVMTESEIRRIWNNQTWQGKKPGDPFVVRGGYNCRHMFVPVK